MAAGIRRFHS